MGQTAEYRVAKRRINELEQKLKKLQREMRELKSKDKQIAQLRKRAVQAEQTRADCADLIEEYENLAADQLAAEKDKPTYTCRVKECRSHDCEAIEAGARLIIVCPECGARYSIENSRKEVEDGEEVLH